jgi:hypothetical protein
MKTTPPGTTSIWLMLVSRTVLFAIFQGLIAVILLISGNTSPIQESARWWVFSVILTNFVSMVLLQRLFKLEGKRYFDLFRIKRQTLWKDLGLVVIAFLLAGPISYIPMTVSAAFFLGSAENANAIMFQPIPTWALVVGILFPLTIALAELPTYYSYVMPRLAEKLKNDWLAWAIAALFLSLQHATLPLVFNSGFIMWRAVMFLPFALYIGLILKFRPRLLPFIVIGHALIDFSTLAVYLMI